MNPRSILTVLSLVVAGIWSSGCSEDPSEPAVPDTTPTALHLRFVPTFGADSLRTDRSYTTVAGESVKFTTLQCYISGIALVAEDGTEVPIDTIRLIDLLEPDTQTTPVISDSVKPGTYRSIRFRIGVPESENHKDAATQDYPLGPNSGMYWSWATGYIFHKIHGRVDSAGTEVSFAYHVGQDERMVEITLDKTFTVKAREAHTVRVNVDYAKLFTTGLNGTDPLKPGAVPSERMHHVGPKELADRISANTRLMYNPGN